MESEGPSVHLRATLQIGCDSHPVVRFYRTVQNNKQPDASDPRAHRDYGYSSKNLIKRVVKRVLNSTPDVNSGSGIVTGPHT